MKSEEDGSANLMLLIVLRRESLLWIVKSIEYGDCCSKAALEAAMAECSCYYYPLGGTI